MAITRPSDAGTPAGTGAPPAQAGVLAEPRKAAAPPHISLYWGTGILSCGS